MNQAIEIFANRANLSSPYRFFALLLFCVSLTCAIADFITVLSFTARLPWVMETHSYDVRIITLQTTASISTFFFGIVLYLIKHGEHLRKSLTEKIRHDPLTGILSREAFLNDIETENFEENVNAFLLIDADFFKRINDTHGHAVGDKALCLITDALRKGIRSTDSIGRIGGEEFGVHLRDVSRVQALEISERLRKNVQKANIRFGYPDVDLSVSIGAVVYGMHIELSSLMKKADELLYKAKENGRNRVEYMMIYRDDLFQTSDA